MACKICKPKLTSGFCAKKYSAIRWLYHKSKEKNGKVITKVESRVQNLKVAFKMWNSFTKRESRVTIEQILQPKIGWGKFIGTAGLFGAYFSHSIRCSWYTLCFQMFLYNTLCCHSIFWGVRRFTGILRSVVYHMYRVIVEQFRLTWEIFILQV